MEYFNDIIDFRDNESNYLALSEKRQEFNKRFLTEFKEGIAGTKDSKTTSAEKTVNVLQSRLSIPQERFYDYFLWLIENEYEKMSILVTAQIMKKRAEKQFA